MRQDTAIGNGIGKGSAAGVPCLDEDATARCGDFRQRQEKLIKLRARSHSLAITGHFAQAHFQQLLIDGFQQGLVTGNRFGVARMAFHPAQHFGTILKQLIAHVGIDKLRQSQALGLDDIKIIAQREGEIQATVAFDGGHLCPATATEGFRGANRYPGPRALVPSPFRSANRLTCRHRYVLRRGGQLNLRLNSRPA